MTCREFSKQIEGCTLTGLNSAGAELLAHGSGCASCAALLQQRNALAGAMQGLRSSTLTMEAPAEIEQNVLLAFRQSAASPATTGRKESPAQPFAFRLSRFFEWRVYAAAAAAAALAVCLGLGLWFLQHSGKTSNVQSPSATAQRPSGHRQSQAEKVAQVRDVAAPSSTAGAPRRSANTVVKSQPKAAASNPSLIQMAQAQGYTPLMLCDPLSCSGDEQVVRLELPATGADGSTSQMADVIVGDDGLVRAIRIVQQ